MNKFYAMAVTAACALGVSAAPLIIHELPGSPVRELEASATNFKQALGPVMLKAPGQAASENAPETLVGKTYVSLYNDGNWACNNYFTVTEGADGGLVFEGLAEGYDVKGTYDAATGTVTIPTEVVIGTHSTYGDITLWALDLATQKYSNNDIVGTVEGNTITFNYGIYGAVTAGGLVVMGDLTAQEPNATATFAQNTNTFELPLLVNKTGDNSIEVAGLSGILYGGYCPVPFTLNATSQTAFMPVGTPVDKQYKQTGTVTWILGGVDPVMGYLDDLTLNVVTSETTSLLSVDNVFYGYPNGQSYNGYTFTNFNISVDFNVFTGEVNGGGDEETDTPTINGLTYLIDREAKTATVTGCLATLINAEIPATFTYGDNEYTVVAVGKEAFMANNSVKTLSIPATVTSFGQDACRNMKSLKTLTVSDMAAWCATDFANGNANPLYNLFSSTRESNWGTVIFGEISNPTTLEIPEGVTKIGRAFYGYKLLEAVTLPSTLTELGDQTFANCARLTEAVIPEGVTTMGSSFWSCSALKSVTLPSTLKTLGNSTFYGCKALESIELPEGLESMGMMVFSSCNNIAKLTCPAAVPPTAGMMTFDDIDATIPVYVPEASINAYKEAAEWSHFTNYLAYTEPQSPFGDGVLDAPVSTWPTNGSAMLPLDGSVKLTYGVDVEVFGKATLNDAKIALKVENNVVSIDYKGLTPSTEYTLTIPAKGIGNAEASNAEALVYTFTTAPADVLFYSDFRDYPYDYSVTYRDIKENKDILAKGSTNKTVEVGGMTFFSGSKGRVVAMQADLNSSDPEADYGPYQPEHAGASARAVQLIVGGNGLYVETPEVEGPCELTFYIGNTGTTEGTLILTDERGDKEKALAEFKVEGAKRMFKYTYSYPYKGAVKFRLYNQKAKVNVNDILIVKGEGPGIDRPAEDPDTEAPVMTSAWPAAGAYAPVEGKVYVTFDEPVIASGKALLNGAELDITVEGSKLSVAYAGLENGKEYTMEIPAVSDEAGNKTEPISVAINTIADNVLYYTDFANYPYDYFTAYNHIPNEGGDNEDIIAKNSTDVTVTKAGITYHSGTNGRVVAMGKPNLFEDAGKEHAGASARCIQISGGENALYAELPAAEGPCELTLYVGNGPAAAASIVVTDEKGDTENPLATFALPAEKKMYRFDYKHVAEGPVTLRIYNMGAQFNLHDILLVKAENSAIDVIEVADDAEAVYYNLQGVRVENPAAGLYIRVRGQKVDKVIVK